ncbi:MAG: 50S ribosomal protein L10 [Bacteroidota bacterium]|nr:50S ribosomal protein L10 [Candidatus Kapabacteria bacterium]MCS7301822.1 50S ribosomal protein L10 [Candidatus Kapabacteria bacterium]MDW8075031.1 50S ribosomal protein L10 [Bacteroidota bacterium]MDW8271670.1 50S ribosomal protein L10 [Bacteroidota bacterium]
MATREQKAQIVAEVAEAITQSSALYFVDFATMTVAEDWELRRMLKSKGARYRVVKNTLLLRALEQTNQPQFDERKLFGQTAVVFASLADPISPAKVLKEYSSKHEGKPRLKLAIVEGTVFDGSQLSVIASLPTREEIIAGILGSLTAPASGIVGTINSVIGGLASVIEEVAKKKAA